MPETLEDFLMQRPPSADRPLQGQTVLVVEDSRFASEALRMICLRSGARVRRADSLAAAERHLATYRPNVVVVDLGLPDGSGAALIERLAAMPEARPVVLAVSGDPDAAEAAEAAGADAFLAKPLRSLAAVQAALLERLPPGARPRGPRAVDENDVRPDLLALKDDLARARDALEPPPGAEVRAYVAQFVSGIARSVDDRGLEEAALRLGRATAGEAEEARRRLARLVDSRLGARAVI